MAPNSPACSFIQASMAGSCSAAPLNRSNSVLINAPVSAFETCDYEAPLPSRQQNCASGLTLLVEGQSQLTTADTVADTANCACRMQRRVAEGQCPPTISSWRPTCPI